MLKSLMARAWPPTTFVVFECSLTDLVGDSLIRYFLLLELTDGESCDGAWKRWSGEIFGVPDLIERFSERPSCLPALTKDDLAVIGGDSCYSSAE